MCWSERTKLASYALLVRQMGRSCVMYLVEGIFIGAINWMLGVASAVSFGVLLSDMDDNTFWQNPLIKICLAWCPGPIVCQTLAYD
jgi:hypothetical protein